MRTFLILLLCIPIFSNAQKKYDFRKVSWRMSIEQVKKNESEVLDDRVDILGVTGNGSSRLEDFIRLDYKDVLIFEKKADLYYEFSSDLLYRIRIIYRPEKELQEKNISETIKEFGFILENLEKYKFKLSQTIQCGVAFEGTDKKNKDNWRILRMRDKTIDDAKLSLVDKMVREKEYDVAFYTIKNRRTEGLVKFYTEYSSKKEIAMVEIVLFPK